MYFVVREVKFILLYIYDKYLNLICVGVVDNLFYDF